MQPRIQLLLVAVIAVITRDAKLANANVLFRFALDFHVKSGDSNETEDVINKTLIFQNHHVIVKNNLNSEEPIDEELTARPDKSALVTTTVGPLRSMSDFWIQEQNLTDAADTKLKQIVKALTELNREISPVVGRSDFVSSKVKIITRYLNILDASAAATTDSNQTISPNKFAHLQKFIKLAEKLKEPPIDADGSERTLDGMVMKLALDKYQIASLQAEVEEQVTAAEEAWQRYVKTKLVEVAV
uniref:Tropomyosin-2 n=1 Tax=Zeugodacus cucurbitae TaxID=28588 RepID=A0A0A1X5X4_ZEUCU